MFFLSAKRCEVERGLHLLRRFLLFVVCLFRSLVIFFHRWYFLETVSTEINFTNMTHQRNYSKISFPCHRIELLRCMSRPTSLYDFRRFAMHFTTVCAI